MCRTSSLKKSVKEYSGFLLFAAFIGSVTWLVHASAIGTRASGSEGQTSNVGQSQRENTCKQCAPPGNQVIYAPLIELPEASGTQINLNCRSPHVMDVTPTFYTRRGEAVIGDVFQMQPAEVKTVNLRTLMPVSIRNRHDWGGMTLSFTGGMLEMWAQLRLMNVNHGNSVDVVFSILQDKRSDVRNAVWWMPENGEAIIAVGNFGNSAARATVKFSNGDSEDVEVPAFGTHLIRKRSEQFQLRSNGDGEAVSVSAPGSNGSLIVAGGVAAIDGSFTSSIRFYDTKNVAQPNLYATNFRLRNVKPRMLLRNTGTETISAIPRFIPVFGDPNGFIDLPSVTLRPNEIADVDIEPLKGAVYGRADFDDVSIQVLNTGTSGSLIGALNGHDSSTGMTYDVPLRDIGGLRNSTGAYPWRLDQDLSTIVSITNIAPMRSEIVVQINYPGGPYMLNPRRLAAGETVTYDLRKIRDEQIPDRNGNPIPRSIEGGQFRWFIHGPGSGRLIGRAEMLSVSQGVSSSYSCPEAGECPTQFSYAFLSPSNVYLAPGDYAVVHAEEVDCDDYFNCTPSFTPYVTGWEVTDPYGAVLYYDNGDNLQLEGFNGGTAYIQADIGYERYYWNNFYCADEGMDIANANGQAHVTPPVTLSGNSTIWWFNDYDSPEPSHWPVVTTLTASQNSGASYKFQVVNGSDKVGLGPQLASTYTSSSNQVDVTSRKGSDNEGDVAITVTVNGTTSNSFIMTVRRPAYLQLEGISYNGGPADYPYGFNTLLTYSVWDNLATRVPNGIPVNEYFTTGITHTYDGSDWSRATPNAYPITQGVFGDNLGVFQSYPFGGWTPTPQSPGNPLSTLKIEYFHQQFWVGTYNPGTGVLVQDDTAVMYLDHGAHEDVVNP